MADNMFKLESQPNWGAAIFVNNKNAFQEDPYHPLVDHIPTCTVEGGVCRGDCLPRGVSAQGVSVQGGVSQHALRQTPPVNRMTERQV